MDNLIEKLKELGFNSYEAKVYIALLKKYPATGYELSQLSDIPQSRAYDALKSLESEGIVFSSNDKPQKYTPISPKELTQRFKRRMSSTIDYLEKKLPSVKESYNGPINIVVGYDKAIDKLKEVIKNTQKSLYLQLWSAEFKVLEVELTDAYDRGVDIKIVGYDNFQFLVFGKGYILFIIRKRIDYTCKAVHLVYVLYRFPVFHTAQNNMIFIILLFKALQSAKRNRLYDIHRVHALPIFTQSVKIHVYKRAQKISFAVL